MNSGKIDEQKVKYNKVKTLRVSYDITLTPYMDSIKVTPRVAYSLPCPRSQLINNASREAHNRVIIPVQVDTYSQSKLDGHTK